MKRVLVAIICCAAFACMESSALAIKVVQETKVEQPQNMVVTGKYSGYRPGTIFVVPASGVRTSYPLEIGKEQMKSLGKVQMNVRVRLTIRQGTVVHVEEVSR